MTIMKIIDGLYFTIGMILFNPLTGESKTPDQLNEDDRATYDACMGAIALLKAQEPRVMTLKEAQTALHNDYVVWVELKDKMICAGIRMDDTDYFTMQNNDVLNVTDFDSGEGAEMYGNEVRCWTSSPTDEQRETVAWE